MVGSIQRSFKNTNAASLDLTKNHQLARKCFFGELQKNPPIAWAEAKRQFAIQFEDRFTVND